ncbi:MAG: hypothetical protein DRP63_01365 [Planctomycetota bacterium]|nr:MAG: hypothetical protein DRP63_01365 [Planctomycetota bacterium]
MVQEKRRRRQPASKEVLLDEMTRRARKRVKDGGEELVKAVFEEMKKALASGQRVVVPDFVSLEVVEEKARIVKGKDGRRMIAPARRRLHIEPCGSFRETVEKARLASIILVVPRNDPFARVVDFHFSRVGWRVLVLHDVDECLKVLREGHTYLCIVDYSLEGTPRLLREVKCNIQTSMIPFVVLFPRGKDPERAPDLRVCGDEHIVEPFEVYTLLAVAEAELARVSEEEVIFRQQVCLQFPTEERYIEEAARIVADLLVQSGMEEERQVAVNAAFREAVLNAAQHGNRYDRNRQIRVLYLLDREKVVIVVADEGPGFDYHFYINRGAAKDAVSAARERYAQGRLGGLGIMLMLRCADRLEYNEKGNSVTLYKYLTDKVPAEGESFSFAPAPGIE